MIKGTEKEYLGADYNIPYDINEFKKIMIAVRDGKIKELKKYKGDINDKIEWYGGKFCPEQSLLSIACQNGHKNIVDYLINKGAKIDDQDEYGSTPLHYCSIRGHLNIVKKLVEEGTNPNKKAVKKFVRIYGLNTLKTSGTKETPLHNACHLGHLDVVKYLISQGASLNIIDYFEETPKQKCEQGKWVLQIWEKCLRMQEYLIKI